MLRELINTSEAKRIDVARLRTDGGTQMRAALDDNTVFEYTQAMAASGGWGAFPPAIAYYDGSVYWLGDGFHRVQAYRDAFPGATDGVPCEVRSGTRRDAILHAAGANADHGLRRTAADKRRSVETLLRDEEWGLWSDNEIARRCNVSPTTVGTIRKALSLSNLDSEKPAAAPAAPAERTYTTKHGTQATMNVGGIGKKAEPVTVEAWQLENVVHGIPNLQASALRTAARQRKGHWLFDTAVSRAETAHPGAWNQTRLIQAMHNVADQMEQAERKASLSKLDSETPTAASLDSLETVDSVTVRVADGKPNMDWEPEEWEAAQRHMPAAKPAPDAIPADLAARGWSLRQVPGSGRWYANNPNGPRATQVFDRPQEAIDAAYKMQRDLLAQETAAWLAQGEQPQAPAEQAQTYPVIDPRAPKPKSEAEAFRMAAETLVSGAKMLKLARQYLNGYHDEAQAAIDVIISDIETLIGDLR
jgi:hypothetical protein